MSQYLDKDGASRIAENFLSKQAEQDVILRNLQFDLKEAEHALVKTIQGPAPLNIRALTRPLDDYVISGNTLQNGTPTPEDPADVVGCGEKSANLLPLPTSETINGITFTTNPSDGTVTVKGTAIINQITHFIIPIPLNLDGDYYMSGCPSGGSYSTYDVYAWDDTLGARLRKWDGTTQSDADFGDGNVEIKLIAGHTSSLRIRTRYGVQYDNLVFRPMIRLPDSSADFVPYGYKLPLTVNGTEYQIYLGQVPTTRRIRKLVLTGEETGWNRSSSGGKSTFYLDTIAPDYLRSNDITLLCSHYKAIAGVSEARAVGEGETSLYKTNNVNQRLYFGDNYSSVDEFKSYLAAQYTAGTPVTVWYVLAEPETGIVNEPLHKIGDYADTISFAQAGVEISTTKGFNTITTDTTVLPSNIEVKGVINNA